MKIAKFTNETWYSFWLILIVISPIFSFIGGYAYFHVLAFFYTISQAIALNKKKPKLVNWIWLLHFPFWLYIIELEIEFEDLIYIIPLNSMLGEILLSIINKKIGWFKWFFFNSLAMLIILLTFYFSGSNDFFQIIVIIIGFAISAFISGAGLYYGFLKTQPPCP